MAFKIVYTEPSYNAAAFFYYAIIVNNDGLYYNPTTEVYELFANPHDYQLNLSRIELVVHQTTLPDAFMSVKGVCKIYKLLDVSGSTADLTIDELVSEQPFVYRQDYGDVVNEKDLLEYSERLLPLLNGAGGSGLQVLGYVGQTQLSQENLFSEVNYSVVSGGSSSSSEMFPPEP